MEIIISWSRHLPQKVNSESIQWLLASIISQINSFIFIFTFFPGNNYENEVISPITSPEGPTDDWVLLVVADSKDDTHLVFTKQQSNGDKNSQTPPNQRGPL